MDHYRSPYPYVNTDNMYPSYGYDPGGYAYQAPPHWTGNQTGPFGNQWLPHVESGMGELFLENDPMELDPGPQAIHSHPPSTGPYVRPAALEDAEEIVQIINWHTTALNPFDPDLELLEAEQVGNFIETSRYRRLPFLVIVQPPDLSQISAVPPRPQIGGLAYIDAFDEIVTEDSIGDLRVYIHPAMMRRGFGTMLVDCILTLCDQYHHRRCNIEWRPIGEVQQDVLRMTQLMCAISYPAQLENRYAFTWHWLKNRFGFEDFGEMRQDRAKYGYEENFYCVQLLINAGRVWRQRQLEQERQQRLQRQMQQYYMEHETQHQMQHEMFTQQQQMRQEGQQRVRRQVDLPIQQQMQQERQQQLQRQMQQQLPQEMQQLTLRQAKRQRYRLTQRQRKQERQQRIQQQNDLHIQQQMQRRRA